MNRMEINGPGADFQIQMKKILSGETSVNRVEANRAYNNSPNQKQSFNAMGLKESFQSTRWMERYFLSLNNVRENDTITICGNLDTYGVTGHSLGHVPIRPNTDQEMLSQQATIIKNMTGLELIDYIDITTRIRTYALKLPFGIVNPNVAVELDEMENSYVITIKELQFKKQCNEAIKQFLTWCDGQRGLQISIEYMFLKRFCDIKSDRLKSEEQKQSAYEFELQKKEHTKEWEERTLNYVQQVDWSAVDIGLGFSMVDPMGAAVELCLLGLPENELSREGILLPKKLHFAELDQGIVIENQLAYFPEEFKTRVLCAMVKHMNEVYKAKQPEFYPYKKWHTICERRDFSMKFSKKFTYYSDEQLGIVPGEGVSFAEWERFMVPGGYEDLYQDTQW